MSPFELVCAGCGTAAPPIDVDPFPFRCRRAEAAPDSDHVIGKVLAGARPGWPVHSSELNPFNRYRDLLYSNVVGPAFSRAVETLDDAIYGVCEQRFRVTPFGRADALSQALGFSPAGGVWVKDETGNVAGSHKGRHLAGIMLYLKLVRDEFPLRGGKNKTGTQGLQHLSRKFVPNQFPLAIASCGNAALAAAVIARAAEWPLTAFVPPDANPAVIRTLEALGTALVTCPRRPGESGDPCYRRFHEAVAEGALPFCCQGPDNGLTIEGGETLAYEIVDQLGDIKLDAVVIQVGGGALASACVQGFERAVALGRLSAMPRVYTVQTQGAAPLARAFDRLSRRVAKYGIADALAYAATHRSEFMWPWEHEPRSVAHGILDDETYDWLAVAKGMLETGGRSLVVDERALKAANTRARQTTAIDVDHTGSAGLAGLAALVGDGEVTPNENVAVIFSGVRRG